MKIDSSYTIKFEDRSEYLYVLVGGKTLSPEIARQYWYEIAEECQKLGKTKILIEKDFAQTVSPPEMLEMGVYLGKILPNRKIAFFDRYRNESINDLGKKIARNRGVKLQVFESFENAEKWLVVS